MLLLSPLPVWGAWEQERAERQRRNLVSAVWLGLVTSSLQAELFPGRV